MVESIGKFSKTLPPGQTRREDIFSPLVATVSSAAWSAAVTAFTDERVHNPPAGFDQECARLSFKKLGEIGFWKKMAALLTLHRLALNQNAAHTSSEGGAKGLKDIAAAREAARAERAGKLAADAVAVFPPSPSPPLCLSSCARSILTVKPAHLFPSAIRSCFRPSSVCCLDAGSS